MTDKEAALAVYAAMAGLIRTCASRGNAYSKLACGKQFLRYKLTFTDDDAVDPTVCPECYHRNWMRHESPWNVERHQRVKAQLEEVIESGAAKIENLEVVYGSRD